MAEFTAPEEKYKGSAHGDDDGTKQSSSSRNAVEAFMTVADGRGWWGEDETFRFAFFFDSVFALDCSSV